jgi:hypothetical protein
MNRSAAKFALWLALTGLCLPPASAMFAAAGQLAQDAIVISAAAETTQPGTTTEAFPPFASANSVLAAGASMPLLLVDAFLGAPAFAQVVPLRGDGEKPSASTGAELPATTRAELPTTGVATPTKVRVETASQPGLPETRDSFLADMDAALADLLSPRPAQRLSAGRRDPFLAYVSAEADISHDGLPSAGELIIVGILWTGDRYMALAETPEGRSYTFRPGDPIRNGRILEVSDNGVTVRYSEYGMSRTITLPIAMREEEQNER